MKISIFDSFYVLLDIRRFTRMQVLSRLGIRGFRLVLIADLYLPSRIPAEQQVVASPMAFLLVIALSHETLIGSNAVPHAKLNNEPSNQTLTDSVQLDYTSYTV